MEVKTYTDRLTMSRAAARQAAQAIRDAIAARGTARIVAATGASQFDFLDALTAAPAIDWTRVEMFHLDEYVGLAIDHPASFPRPASRVLIGSTASGTRRASPAKSGASSPPHLSTSRSSASARTATSPSTIRLPISKPTRRT